MKKIVSLMLAAAMTMGLSAGAAFADEYVVDGDLAVDDGTGIRPISMDYGDEPVTTISAPIKADLTDLPGTPYQVAVNFLMDKSIINGYEDGTFKPLNTITRAEASTLIYKALGGTTGAQTSDATFTDLAGSSWAQDAINWCSSHQIVKGYGDGTFKPTANVTYNEFATMLVRAYGLEIEGMQWPGDYISLAQGSGLVDNLVDATLNDNGSSPATRGNCALMLTAAVEKYADGSSAANGDNPSVPSTPGENPSDKPADGNGNGGNNDGNNSDKTPSSTENALSNYSGNAYGIITGSGQAINKKGDVAVSITLLMGDNEYELAARDSAVSLPTGADGPKDVLVRVKLSFGQITAVEAIEASTQKTQSTDKVKLVLDDTDPFRKVISAGKTYVHYATSGSDTIGTYFGVNTPVVVYVCKPDGSDIKYETGTISDIYEGCYVVGYSIDKDSDQLADVLIVVDKDDISILTKTGDASGDFKGHL